MVKEKERSSLIARAKVERVLSYMPRGIGREISEMARSIYSFYERLSEVRLRAGGVSSVVIGGVCYPMVSVVSAAALYDVLLAISDGALYASRDTIIDGYISIGGGVRVGVIGSARYDGGRALGVGDISTLVFRLPASYCEYGEELYRAWLGTGGENMIIASPPMGGKTTALASLAGYIGRGRDARHVVIVDERCEFDGEQYRDSEVDILRGYKRESGIEVALRTMSPEVLIADEIATQREADAIMSVSGAGVTVITSVHASGVDDLYHRRCIASLLSSGMFSSSVILHHDGEKYGFDLYLGGTR